MKNTIQITLLITILLASSMLNAMNNNNHHNNTVHPELIVQSIIAPDELATWNQPESLFDECNSNYLSFLQSIYGEDNQELSYEIFDFNPLYENNTPNDDDGHIYPAESCIQVLNNNNNNNEDSMLINTIRGYQPDVHKEQAIVQAPHNVNTKISSSRNKRARDTNDQLQEEQPQAKHPRLVLEEQSELNTQFSGHEKTLSCHVEGCNKTYFRNSDLTRHIKQFHPGEHRKKQFACSYEGCNKVFDQAENLTKHIRTHTGERPYSCTYAGCNHAFAQRGNLTKHIMATHTGEKRFSCTYEGCDKAFMHECSLKTHMRNHADEKPFVCPYEGCNSSFKQTNILRNHMRKHSNEKPYKCNVEGCEKLFHDKSNLKIHMRIHTEEKPFTCPECGVPFSQKGNLQRHIKAIHNK